MTKINEGSDGTREAAAAARWWADRLAGTPDVALGPDSAMSEALTTFGQSRVKRPTAEQVETFRAHLEQALLDGPAKSHGWTEAIAQGEARWGSALRSFGVDYGPDKVLGDALEAAGLNGRSPFLLPLKSVMWFNPGIVTAALGYNSPEIVVWAADGTDRAAVEE